MFVIKIIIGEDVPLIWVNSLKEYGACIEAYCLDIVGAFPGSLYRIQPILKNEGLGCFLRDADSFLTESELDSMKRFIDSDNDFHIVRDHPNHLAPIMAGLFGLKNNGYLKVKNALIKSAGRFRMQSDDWWSKNKSAARRDERILADYVYPEIYRYAYIESRFVVYANETGYIRDCKESTNNQGFMGRIDPNYNDRDPDDMDAYRNGLRRLYLPYWLHSLFRYRFLYRFSKRIL